MNVDIESSRRQAEEVRAALRRIDDGTYGYCVDCGPPWDEERLRARPEAPRCLGDQARAEQAQ